jgi:hypothetical protein
MPFAMAYPIENDRGKFYPDRTKHRRPPAVYAPSFVVGKKSDNIFDDNGMLPQKYDYLVILNS